MLKKSKITASSLLLTLPILIISNQALAKPWLDAGDMKLRHELQLLSDARLLDSPLTTWPLTTKDIHENLREPIIDSPMLPALKEAYANVKQRLKEEDYNSNFKITGNARSKELLIRDFSGEGREKYSLSYDGEWGTSFIDLRLKATVADNTDHPDDKAFRLDESYIAGDLGNWKVTVGKQSRYWGPGWDGSLILSNNARPIPSISVENVLSRPEADDFFLLRWLGTSKLHAFVGQLESDRGIPDAKLIGTRFTFRPYKPLEIGLHRTIQWGGDGQDESFSDFGEAFFGLNDNSQDDLLAGNSIAGLDFRWKLPVGGQSKHYSVYGQYIGEDRAAGSVFLGDEIFMLGGSVAGFSEKLKGSWRAYIEATDTSAGSFKGRSRNNIVYNHNTYTDGYRYLDVSMGHGIDSDSKMVSTGLILSQANGNFWRSWIKHAKLNEDGIGNNPIAQNGRKWTDVGLSLNRNLNIDTNVNMAVQYVIDDRYDDKKESDLVLSIGFTKSF